MLMLLLALDLVLDVFFGDPGRQKTSHAFSTTMMPHPAIGNTGQKNPCRPVTAQITTRNALTSVYRRR